LKLADYKVRARVIKAMAHPSRLLIIDILSEGEQCVCELQKRVGSDMSTVSKHLALMRSAGLVTDLPGERLMDNSAMSPEETAAVIMKDWAGG
jgi:DNA-binding transcriptional ArsR family regulator